MEHFESLYPPESREKEIDQVLTCIKSGNFSQVVSLPGGGASLLFGLLAYNKALREKHLGKEEENYHFVFCNFSEIRNKPLSDALRFLLTSLADSISLSSRPKKQSDEWRDLLQETLLRKIPRQARNDNFQAYSNDNVFLFHSFKKAIEHLTLEKNLKIVYLFDRFEDYLPMLENEFFSNLRILRRDALYKFSVVFALSRPLEQLVDPQIIKDIYEFIADHTTYLNIYDKPTLEFRIKQIEKAFNKNLDENLLEKIISLTAGHINLTRLSVETLLESVEGDPSTSLGMTTPVLSEFLLKHKSIQNALLDIWKSFTPAEQNILASNSQPPRHSGNQAKPEHPESLYILSASDNVGDSGQARMTQSYLENIGIIKNSIITIKLLEIFIKQNPSLQSTKQHIMFDETSKEIKKGELLISDKLSSLEYRLLKFFLQNSNRIIERNDVINAVWEEEGATIGISDEALDQLVFRVRRKIEDDPNNPSHLQTVKGRGFRFLP